MYQAANPGCILEDFIRWYSPADWIKNKSDNEATDFNDDSSLPSEKGHLSTRMQDKGIRFIILS